jgi:Protein of unknown function (DUF1822)
MNTHQPNISKLTEIYSEHDWIDLAEYPDWPIDEDTTPVDLNLQCKWIVKEWLSTSMGLASEEDFPYSGLPDRDRLVSQLVNGFCLKINDSKIIFIPSDRIDISSFEVAQEWVDLTNWMGDYYVPIQVDLDAQYLHLWGLITHQELKRIKEPDDRVFRYYHVASDRTIANLEILWTSCELSPAPRSKNIYALDPAFSLANGISTALIDRVRSELSANFPRLILPFSQWGAILNDRECLDRYLKIDGLVALAKPEEWWIKQIDSLETYWKNTKDFLYPSQLKMAFRGSRACLREAIDRKRHEGISLETEEQINISIEQLYRSQTEIFTPDRNLTIDDLVSLMKNTTQEHIRLKAAEYLWKIDPDLPQAPIRKMRDLESDFGYPIALMIGVLNTPDERVAILLRLYSLGEEFHLPQGLKLALLDPQGKPFPQDKPYQSISRAYPRNEYIQLYFVATPGDRFRISITLNGREMVEKFLV